MVKASHYCPGITKFDPGSPIVSKFRRQDTPRDPDDYEVGLGAGADALNRFETSSVNSWESQSVVTKSSASLFTSTE